MPQLNDLSRSLTSFVQGTTLVAVIELSLSSWLVAGVVPGVARQPLKKLDPDAAGLLRLLHRWRDEAVANGCVIERIVVAYEAGRDGFWLARWLWAHEIEAHVIHSTSVAVSREHRRAKTDRLDTAMLLRVFMGWLRGEPGHCGMVAVPTAEEEDAKRPHRERENLVGERTRIINRMRAALIRLGIRGFKPELRRAAKKLDGLRTPEGLLIPPNTLDEIRRDLARLAIVREQIDAIEQARLTRIEQAPDTGPNAMVLVGQHHRRGHRDRRYARPRGAVSQPARPSGGGALCRAYGLARRKRRQTAREGAGKGGQRPRPPRPDPTRLAFPAVPEGQRAGAMVSRSDRGGKRGPQDHHDRGPRPQAAHRAVAVDHDRRNPGRRAHEAGCGLIGTESMADTDRFSIRLRLRNGMLMTIRGGGNPSNCMAWTPS